ncbi:copper resistance CopC/CopD family protein [Streptomyces sp. NRRL B-24085]|uniref:copper resistance CopC/CopD family protein n=1 Tax=Streptomyces sp. NRRL B-24085 TaxID=1709476 RepID=UPI0006B32A88|nr:copper resistance protein CopC [Streptomyces sp. NRRL B-24085]
MLLGTVLVLLLFGGAGAASAHAALRATDPEDGTVLKSAPRDITLTFTESVGLLDDSFRVLDPDGKRLRVGDAGHGPGGSDTARVTLPARLAQGTYTVAWRVVSADSHPVSGAFTFSVGRPSPAVVVADTGPTEDPATESLFNMGRYLAYLAAALLIGTAVFLAVCRPPEPSRLRRLLWAGWGTLLGSTVFLLVLRAPYESGAGPSAAFSLKALERTLGTRPGEALLVRLALLLVACFFVVRLLRPGASRLPRAWQAAGGALAVGLALTWAAAEHASAGIQVPVAMTSAVLHVLAMAVWLGGLAALLTTLYRAEGQLPAAVVARFSRLAFASVTVLVATGVYQSWRGLGSWDAVTGTTYGHLLVLKLLAVTLLLAAARLSRRWTGRLVTVAAQAEAQAEAEAETVVREKVAERVGGGPASAEAEVEAETAVREKGAAARSAAAAHRYGLRRSVLAEVAVGVVVLVLSTVLSGTLPGRAQAEAAEAGPATAGLPAASLTTVPFAVGGATGSVQVTLDPGRTGDNSVQAIVYAADGGLATVPELRLSFTLPAQRIGPIDARLENKGGYWGTNDLTLPLAGDWRMKATIRVSDVDQISVTKTVRIAG